jgi:FkbM family methyltransferase
MFHPRDLRLYWRLAAALGPRGVVAWRNARRSGGLVRTALSTYPLHLRGKTSDADVFSQIFVEREYRCIDHLNPRIIIDAGANVGYSSAYLLTRFPQARVIALEPDPANFAAAKKNLAHWADRVTLLEAALWSKRGTVSLRPGTEGWGRQVATGEGVSAVDIPFLLEKFDLESIDLLKVDIEGAEKEVFSASDWVSCVRNIVVELHGPEESRIFHEAIKHRPYSVSECGELTVCLQC